jgi:hypothetical protein
VLGLASCGDDAGSAPVAADAGVAPLAVSPATFDFKAIGARERSEPTSFTVKNMGTVALAGVAGSLEGESSADFVLAGDDCTQGLAPGASCALTVRFEPGSQGTKKALLAIAAGTFKASAELTGSSVPPASLAIEPALRDFGTAAPGQSSAPETLTVTNTGNAPTGTIVPTVDGVGFLLGPTSCTEPLAPGRSCLVQVRFAPVGTGAHSGQVVVSSTPGGTATAMLTGVGQTRRQPTASPDTVDFGFVDVGSSVGGKKVHVVNPGQAPLTSLMVLVAGTNASEFAVKPGDCPPTLPGSVGCDVEVVFSPHSEGLKTARLNVVWMGAPAPVIVALSGTGLTGDILVISPKQQRFGATAVGSRSAAVDLMISNVGGLFTGPPIATLAGHADDFVLGSAGCPMGIPPGGSCVVQVAFKPSAVGERSALLAVKTSPTSAVVATLSGLGVPPGTLAIAPGQAKLSPVAVGSIGQATTLTVTNQGGGPLGPLSVTLLGPDATQFSFTGGNCLQSTLAAGASCAVSVMFVPKTTGDKRANVTVSAGGSTVSAELAATGLPPAGFSFSPAELKFGATGPNTTTAPLTLTITNSGGEATGKPTLAVRGRNPGHFVLVGHTCTKPLEPSESCQAQIKFAPLSLGELVAELWVSGSPGGTSTALLTGMSDVVTLKLEPLAQGFADTLVGQRGEPVAFALKNVGTAGTGKLQIGTTGDHNQDFVVVTNTCEALLPDETCMLTVAFKPTAAGARGAKLVVIAGGTARAQADLTGKGLGLLEVAPEVADFGPVIVNADSAPVTLTVTARTSTGTLGTTADLAGSFVVVADACQGQSLAMGGHCAITVQFSPKALGLKTGTITVGSGDLKAQGKLSGVGMGPISVAPAAVDLGSTAVGVATAAAAFTVTNAAGAPDTGALTVSFAGADVAGYSLTADGCTGTSLPAGGSCMVSVIFTPAAPGGRVVSLVVRGMNHTTAATVSAMGVAP